MAARGQLVSGTVLLTVALASLGLGLLAVVEPLLALGAAVGIAFVTFVVGNLTLGVLLFSLVAFMEVLPGVGDISFAKVAGAVVALSWIATMAVRHDGGAQLFTKHPTYAIACVLFVTWGVAGMLWAESSTAVLANTQRYALNLLLVFIVYTAVRTREHALWLVGAFILGVLLSAGYGTFISAGDLDAAAEGRTSGADIDSNYLATWLVAGTVLGFALTASKLSPAARTMGLAGGLLCCLAMLTTVSRTGLTSLAVALVVGIAFAGPRRRLAVAGGMVAVVAAVVLYFAAVAPQAALERVSSLGGGTGRNDIWTVGLRMVEDRPVRGVGVGNFPISSVHYLVEPGTILRDDFIVDTPKVAHNIYLESLAEGGIVGFLLFVFILGFSLVAAYRAAHRFAAHRDHTMEVVSRGAFIAMAAVLTGSFFNSQQYSKPIWLLLALGPALYAISAHGRSAREPRP